jgi:dihydroflavonol-4-reductase
VRRVVHTSSVAALGVPRLVPGGQPVLMDETHSWNYRPEWWPYGYSKYQAELAVQEAVAQGLDVVIVNPTVVIGAGDLNRISGNTILQVARNRIPVAPPGGLNVIHIDDVVRGHLAALERGRTGERYILGNENLTHQRFLRMIAEVVDVRPPSPVVPAALLRWMAGPAKQAGRWLPLPISADNLRRAGYYFYFDTLKARAHLGLGQLRPTYEAITEAYAYFCEKGWM